MLKRTVCAAYFLLAIFTLLTAFYVLPVDLSPFQEEDADGSSVAFIEKKEPTEQTREKVSKDLWMTKKTGERLHHHLTSPHSILIAYPKGDCVELVEKMYQMNCYVQEEVECGLLPKQQIRVIEAEEAIYTFDKQEFTSPKMSISLLHLPGRDLPKKVDLKSAYLRGIAYQASLSFHQNSPCFTAKQFKAKIDTEKKNG